jgi:hypothetical protein
LEKSLFKIRSHPLISFGLDLNLNLDLSLGLDPDSSLALS